MSETATERAVRRYKEEYEGLPDRSQEMAEALAKDPKARKAVQHYFEAYVGDS